MSENDTHEPSEDTQPEEYVDAEEEFPSSVDWTREYHLTPKGWVNGTYKYYGKVPGKGVARPSEAVETWEEHCHQTSRWSLEKYSHREIWRDQAWTDEDRAKLRKKFPAPFEDRAESSPFLVETLYGS